MTDIEELIQLLSQESPLVAMLAPSFPIVYQYPMIIGKLKRLGFRYVVEVAVGAKKTNKGLLAAFEKNPNRRCLTSPCAGFVRLIRQKYPHLQKYMLSEVDSPMGATARIVREKYPGFRPVFIGPCFAKKFEAKEDYPNLNILVLTYKELAQVFDHFKLDDFPGDCQEDFDIKGAETRLYPISGGLTDSSQIRDYLADDRIEVISGLEKCEEAIKRFEETSSIQLLDILFCDGGCINGPGVESDLTLAERRQRVVDYWNKK